MKIPTWAFAFIRFGLITLIYLHFGPRYDLLFGQPLLYYGLPFLMLFATLGLHRYWMFALGTLLICTSLGQLAPDYFDMDRFRNFMLGMITFFAGFTPCDRDYSIRSMWSKDEPGFFEFKADPQLTWNLFRILVCFMYLRFLLVKTTAQYFDGHYITRNLVSHFWGADFLFAPWFVPACILAAVVLYAINVGLAVAVWFPRTYSAFVPAALLFHATHLGLLGYLDMTQLLFLVLLTPFAAVQRLDKPLTIHQGIPVSF